MIPTGLNIRALLGLVAFLAAMALVIVRPRNLNEAWPAIGGTAALLSLGLLTLGDLVVACETTGVLLFLAGMMIISTALEMAGVFTWAAS